MKNMILMSAMLAGLLAACGTVKKVGKATTALVTSDEPQPEAKWNAEGTWRRIGADPPTYVPSGFVGTPGEEGEWLRDSRDGKQLFVPVGGVDGMPAGVLRAEAWKATRE